jgi:hypothetical protein
MPMKPNPHGDLTNEPALEPSVQTFGHLVDGPFLDPLHRSVGRLIVTCGCLEGQTYRWIELFKPDEKEKWRKKYTGFDTRRNRVIEIIRGLPIDPLIQEGAVSIWDDAKVTMELRHVVAHSPIILQDNGPDTAERYMIRVFDYHSYKDGDCQEYNQHDIDNATMKVDDVNARLEGMFTALTALMGIKVEMTYRSGMLPQNQPKQ